MGKPTEEEYKQAIEEAIRMREQEDDPHHMAKALLNLNYRLKYLQRVLHQADYYLHFGQEEAEHTKLLKMIKEAKHAEQEEDPDTDSFGT